MEIGEYNSLDRRTTNMWGRQGLAIMGVLVIFVVQWRVMIGSVVAPFDSPGGPIKTELILGGAATQPIKPHVHIFGLTKHNGVVSDFGDGGVVSLKCIKWLKPTHSNECLE